MLNYLMDLSATRRQGSILGDLLLPISPQLAARLRESRHVERHRLLVQRRPRFEAIFIHFGLLLASGAVNGPFSVLSCSVTNVHGPLTYVWVGGGG